MTGDPLRRAWLGAAAGLLVLLVAAGVEPALGRAAPRWDADYAFAPWFMLVADHARAGRLLGWNPWSGGGSPDFADPQMGAMSPLTTAFGLVTGGSLAGFWAYSLAIWYGGALGALLLARHLGAPPWGGFVVASGFAFSGYFMGHATHTSFLHAYAALPWMVWRLDRALGSGGARAAVEAGAIWGVSALAGYPGQVAANAGFGFLWLLGRVVLPADGERPGRRFARASAALALFALVGVIVLLPAYAALVTELRGYSERSGPLAREMAVGDNALHPLALLSFSSPSVAFFKAKRTVRLWPYTDVTSGLLHAGAAVTWLFAFALAARRRDRWDWWVAGVGAAGLLLALGRALPFRGWMYDLFPPSRYSRHASLFTSYWLMALAVVAARATRLVAEAAPARAPIAAAAAAALGSAAAFGAVLHAGGFDVRDQRAALVHLALAWAGIFAAALALARGRSRGAPAILVLVAAADAGATFALSRPVLYELQPQRVEHWRALDAGRVASLAPSWHRFAESRYGLGNRNLIAKEPVLAAWTPLHNPLHILWTRKRPLVEAATGSERVFFSASAVPATPSLLAFDAFKARTDALGAPPLVLHSRAAMLEGRLDAPDFAARGIADAPAAIRVPATVSAYTTDSLGLEVDCPSAGWLWVTERWGRSWTASVNGREVEVLGANFIFRAVPVAGGRNTVKFAYAPRGRRLLVALSWSCFGAVCAWSALAAFRRARAALPR